MPVDDDLARVRRAAFELVREDPSAAVKELRRLVRRGGDIEILARGALGEILLEQFGDLDGALHEFEAVLRGAPDLAAAEIGRSRALSRSGRTAEAADARTRAVALLLAPVEKMRAGPGEVPEGIEENLLTSIELALEDLDEPDAGPSARARPPDALLDWAQNDRLFDSEDSDEASDDWRRFAALRGLLAARERGLDAGLAAVASVAEAVPLAASCAAHARSLVREAAGDAPGAAEDARISAESALPETNEEEVVRASGLLVAAERTDDAEALLRKALEAARPDARRVFSEALERLPRKPLVRLGVPQQGGERP